MQIRIKLFATYREYLPLECKRGVLDINAAADDTAVTILIRLGVPVDEASVILVNGRSPDPDQLLQEGDVVAAFPAIAGGAQENSSFIIPKRSSSCTDGMEKFSAST